MSLKKRLSHDILHARTDDRKLTQQQAADAVFISLREYQKIEKGDILPGTEIFLRLVYFFDLDIKDYLEEANAHVSIRSF